MSTILITGGCGFIGSNLAMAFLRRGDRVVAFDNLSRRGSDILRQRIQEAGAGFVRGDIRHPADLDSLSGPFDLMITRRDSLTMDTRRIESDDPYFRGLGMDWSAALSAAVGALPSPPWMRGGGRA